MRLLSIAKFGSVLIWFYWKHYMSSFFIFKVFRELIDTYMKVKPVGVAKS